MDSELIEILKRMEANIARMDANMKTMDANIEKMDAKIGSIEAKVDKNTIMLEDLTKKVQLIAEVQTSHKEQNERQTENVMESIGNRSGLIETAVTNVSKDTKEIKDSIEVLKEMTGKHEVDINILKRRPV